jgi:hypothetical protein
MNGLLIIAVLLVLVLILAILLMLLVHQKREYLDFLRNIHAAIGLTLNGKPNVVEFMDQIRKLNEYKTTQETQPDAVSISEYVGSESVSHYTFLHATFHRDTAHIIIQEGFKFEDSLYKTTHLVSADPVDIKYKVHLVKQHGNFIVIINIPKELYDFAVSQLSSRGLSLQAESILSSPIDEGEMQFLLPSQFVRGFVNVITGEQVENESFMHEYLLDSWKKIILDKIEAEQKRTKS